MIPKKEKPLDQIKDNENNDEENKEGKNKSESEKGVDNELQPDDEVSVDGGTAVVEDGRVDASPDMSAGDGVESLPDVTADGNGEGGVSGRGDDAGTDGVSRGGGIGEHDESGSESVDSGGDHDELVDEWAGFEDSDEAVEEATIVDTTGSHPEEEAVIDGAKVEPSESVVTSEVISVVTTEVSSELNPRAINTTTSPEQISESNPDSTREHQQEIEEESLIGLDEEVAAQPVGETPEVEEEMEEKENDGDDEEEKEAIVTTAMAEEASEADTKLLSEIDSSDTAEEDVIAAHPEGVADGGSQETRARSDDNDMEVHVEEGVGLVEGDVLDPIVDDGAVGGVVHPNHDHDNNQDNDEDHNKNEDQDDELDVTLGKLDIEVEEAEEPRDDNAKEGVTLLVPIATVPTMPSITDIMGDGMSSFDDNFMVRLFRQREKAHRSSLEFHYLMVVAATVFLYALAALTITCSLLVSM